MDFSLSPHPFSTLPPHTCTKERPHEDVERRWPSISQEERPHQIPTLLGPGTWTSSLQNCEKIDFHFLSCPVCVLLWQPEQNNIMDVSPVSPGDLSRAPVCSLLSSPGTVPARGCSVTHTGREGPLTASCFLG